MITDIDLNDFEVGSVIFSPMDGHDYIIIERNGVKHMEKFSEDACYEEVKHITNNNIDERFINIFMQLFNKEFKQIFSEGECLLLAAKMWQKWQNTIHSI